MDFKENLSTPVSYECDVLVAGGGFGGIAAALAAARENKKVILLERQFMLGGLATAGIVTIYLPLCDGYGQITLLIAAVSAYAAGENEIVVFLSVTVQPVAAHTHEHAFFNVELGHVPFALGNLVGCAAVHTVQDGRVTEEHLLLIC